MGIFFCFIFSTFLLFAFIFFETEKAVHGRGVHLVIFLATPQKVSNGAPPKNAPLVTRFTNGAPGVWCAITSFEKKKC
jgi:hypothetical protein